MKTFSLYVPQLPATEAGTTEPPKKAHFGFITDSSNTVKVLPYYTFIFPLNAEGGHPIITRPRRRISRNESQHHYQY